MKKRILLPTLIAGSLLTASLAFAGPGGCGSCDKKGTGCGGDQGMGQGRQVAMTMEQHEERTEQRLETMSIVLELSADQKQQLSELFSNRWQNNQQLREQMQVSRDTMRATKTADNFNEADFRAQAAKQAELKTEMMVRKIKFQDEVYALLTPEQRIKADQLGGMMMGGGKGKGKGHRGGFGI